MNSYLDSINELAILECEIKVSFFKAEEKTILFISHDQISYQHSFDNHFFAQIIEKPFFKNLGLSYDSDNNIDLKAEVIFTKDDKKVQAIISNDNILILGQYTWSDIHDSIHYIRLNTQLVPKNISSKIKKI